jgi:hypothetical protein
VELNAAALPASLLFENAPSLVLSTLIGPLFDTMRVFTVRVWNKQSPFKADRNHMHHLLLKLGLSHMQVTILLSALHVITIVIVFMFRSWGNSLLIGMIVGMALLFNCIVLAFLRLQQHKTEAVKVAQVISIAGRPSAGTERLRIHLRAGVSNNFRGNIS